MAIMTEEEYALKRELKHLGIFRKVTRELTDLMKAKNGGVAIICGDGDIDVGVYHRKEFSERPHLKADFGGPLLLLPAFKAYDPCYAKNIVANIKAGMSVKKTKTVFCYFHYPCGMAVANNHSFFEVIKMMPEAVVVLKKEGFEKVHILFHAKRLNKKKEEEQNTYIVDVESLQKYLAEH